MQMRFLKASATLLAVLIITAVSAQDKNERQYCERSLEVKQEIFGTKVQAFEVKKVPDEFKDEGAVIIARSVNYFMDKKKRIKMTLFGPAGVNRMSYITTIREKVKINDQTALDEYSSLEYRKQIDKTTSFGLFSKMLDKAFTFIGVKITKPDGKVIELNTDEEILTKDEKKIKEGKIAVSGLQIGDIIDYYIRIEEIQDDANKTLGPYYFVMAGDHPIMNLAIRFQIDKRAGIAYKAANGAPQFKQSTNEDGDFVFELNKNNIPKITSQMWSNAVRQLPYIEIKYKAMGGTQKPFISGLVTTAVTQEDYLKEIQLILDQVGYKRIPEVTLFSKQLKEELDKTVKGKGDKYKQLSEDSLAKMIFYTWQHAYGYKFYIDGKLTTDCSINRYSPSNFYALLGIHKLMQEFGIDNELVVVTSTNSTKTENIIDYGDYEMILRTRSDKPIYFFMDNRFHSPYEIPTRYQGQDATALFVEKKKAFLSSYNSYDRHVVKIPVANANDNSNKEVLNVSFKKDSINVAVVDRTVSLTGFFKSGEQIRLALPEENEKQQAAALGILDQVAELKNSKKTKKVAEEFEASFAASRTKWKDQFKEEIQGQFGVEPKEVMEYGIKDYSIRHNNKAFIYNSTFNMEGWVKKAGNNYIFEAGKLVGTFSKVEEKERARKIDIYMPCARSFSYTINITIPDGYKAKGIEAFNKKVSNDVAAFETTASLNGNVLNIICTRAYNHAFEPVANWSKLLEVMDAFYDFTQQKILFEKAK
jgi:uncharacterized protein YnzC (UPF0291/DUF896 family)